ncbi:MAG: hypothetical protein E6G95_20450 [Alphaproteobacteria bacterium]|nr:MAG: hypothetical protein E6G95_20450 [Alphaproteobacteria bacterium]
MRHLMWILTWIAVGLGGALGAASVIMLSGSRMKPAQAPEAAVPPRAGEPVVVSKPRPGLSGRSPIGQPRPGQPD